MDGVATLEKLANGGAPSKIVTKLANGAPPLVNGENGERSGTALSHELRQPPPCCLTVTLLCLIFHTDHGGTLPLIPVLIPGMWLHYWRRCKTWRILSISKWVSVTKYDLISTIKRRHISIELYTVVITRNIAYERGSRPFQTPKMYQSNYTGIKRSKAKVQNKPTPKTSSTHHRRPPKPNST